MKTWMIWDDRCCHCYGRCVHFMCSNCSLNVSIALFVKNVLISSIASQKAFCALRKKNGVPFFLPRYKLYRLKSKSGVLLCKFVESCHSFIQSNPNTTIRAHNNTFIDIPLHLCFISHHFDVLIA